MKNLVYETQGTNTYLVYEIKKADTLDTMSLGMLTNNKINGLVQTIFTQMDDQKFIKYNVTSLVSVQQFFSGIVNCKKLIGVFSGIINAMVAAEDYMLDPTSILIDLNYIFTNVSTFETSLICLPLVDCNLNTVNYKDFFRNIISKITFDSSENCDYVGKILNYLNGNQNLILSDFKIFLDDINNEQYQSFIKKEKNDISNLKNSNVQIKAQQSHSTLTQASSILSQEIVSRPDLINDSKNVNQKKDEKNITNQDVSNKEDSDISLFYLLQHYNKERAALYKAQKKEKKLAKKEAKKDVKVQKESKKTPKIKSIESSSKSMGNFGFAVPGQQTLETSEYSHEKINDSNKIQEVPTSIAQSVVNDYHGMFNGQSANFGETTVLSNSSAETTVLVNENTMNQVIYPYLIRKKNNEKILLNKPVFRVGKEKSYVDYFIGDNTAISRSHANFIIKEGNCFIVDTNSTNHSFVNGNMIQSNVEVAISNGDIIRLANEDFEFKMY